MKNLFDYATKELSQDAFLRWLLENYDCENEKIRSVCGKLIDKFTDGDLKINRIRNLRTNAQESKIDITVHIEDINNKKYVIAIEDKTHSKEHDNQLQKYREYLNKKYPKAKKYFIFYKTDLETYCKSDLEEATSKGWKPFLLKDIYLTFKNYRKTDSEILNNYSEHIVSVYQMLTIISNKNIKDWQILNFKTYLEKQIIEKYKDFEYATFDHWGHHGIYSSLGIFRFYENGKYRLSMEVIPRLFSKGGNKFELRICFIRIKKNKKVEAKDDIKLIFRNLILNSGNKNIRVNGKIKKSLASGAGDYIDNLKYDNKLNEITKTLYDAIDWFLDICKKDYEEIVSDNAI